MSLVLNEEQTILKHTAQEFFGANASVAALRARRDQAQARGFDDDLWRQMVEMGWPGIIIPEALGGSDFGLTGAVQILECAGRALAASPLLSSAMVAPSVLLQGEAADRHRALLEQIARGEVVVALAVDEQGRHNPAHNKTVVQASGSASVLDGSKVFVADGSEADYLIVVCGGPDETGLYLVATNAPGVTRTTTRLVDSGCEANFEFSQVQLKADDRIAVGAQAAQALACGLDAGRVGLAAEMLGIALEAFERTVAYLKLREQFDVPIGSFQALKHRAAIM